MSIPPVCWHHFAAGHWVCVCVCVLNLFINDDCWLINGSLSLSLCSLHVLFCSLFLAFVVRPCTVMPRTAGAALVAQTIARCAWTVTCDPWPVNCKLESRSSSTFASSFNEYQVLYSWFPSRHLLAAFSPLLFSSASLLQQQQQQQHPFPLTSLCLSFCYSSVLLSVCASTMYSAGK